MALPTGEIQQLVPDVYQIVGAEEQQPRQYDTASQPVLPTIEESQKHTPPPSSQPLVPVPDNIEYVEDAITRQTIFGVPVLRVNKYTGSDDNYVELVRWKVSSERTGDLNEISLKSDDDSNTRYRIYIGGIDQQIPEDRSLSTPVSWRWDRTVLPPQTEIVVQVKSVDGATTINVNGSITGTER